MTKLCDDHAWAGDGECPRCESAFAGLVPKNEALPATDPLQLADDLWHGKVTGANVLLAIGTIRAQHRDLQAIGAGGVEPLRKREQDDIDRLVRALDIALHGEADAAQQASLCDLVGLTEEATRKLGRPVLAAAPAQDDAEVLAQRIANLAPPGLEAIQWRNIRKVVKALADFNFGGPNDPQWGVAHLCMTQGLTAKDGLDILTLGLEPLAAPVQEHRPNWLPFSVRMSIAQRHGTKVTAAFNKLVSDVIETYIATHAAAPAQAQEIDRRTPPDMLVNGGALKLALNVLRRDGKGEVADELEKTAISAQAQEDARDAALPCWWSDFIQNVAELPDRNSPEDEPDAMLATAEELGACAIAARAAQGGAA